MALNLVICKWRLAEIVQQPVFLLERVSSGGIPHYAIILFGFNAVVSMQRVQTAESGYSF